MASPAEVGEVNVGLPFGLPQQDIIITTDVDRLIQLLKERRQIPVKEAAEVLGVTLETVESWVGFLEEEGLVTLNYKFTTPFITYLEPEEEVEVEVEAPKHPGGFFMFKDGDYSKKKAETPSGISGVAPMRPSTEPKQGAGIPGMLPVPEEPKQTFSPTPEIPKPAPRPVPQPVVQPEPKPAPEPKVMPVRAEVPKPIPQVVPEPAPEPPQEVEEGLPSLVSEQPLAEGQGLPTGDFREWVGETYKLIETGDIEKARKFYTMVRRHLESIPVEHHDERKEVEHHLLKLNRDLSLIMRDAALSRANELEAEVAVKLDRLHKQLSKGKLPEAERTYVEVEHLYAEFPPEMLVRKLTLQMEILKHYQEVIKKKQDFFPADHYPSVETLFHELKKYTDAGQLKDNKTMGAAKARIKEIYLSLPEDVVSKEAVLTKELLQALPDIVALRQSGAKSKFSEKADEVKALILEVRKRIDQKRFVEAEQAYARLKGAFDMLPPGFDEEKAKLLLEIYELHGKLVPQLIEQMKRDFHARSEEIEKHIGLAERYMKKDKVDLARDVYREIMMTFNRLPEGFLDESTNLRVELLSLYKELLIKSDISLIGHLSRPAGEAYSAMLALLVNVHAHVENEEFELMEQDYKRLEDLFGQLPDSMSKHKTRLSEEVAKVKAMVHLYKNAQRLQTFDFSDTSQKEKIQKQMAAVKKHYTELIGQSPEDVALYRYVYSIYATYLAALREGASLPAPSPKKRAKKKKKKAGVPEEPMPEQDMLDEEEKRTLLLTPLRDIYGRAVLYLNEGKLGKAHECLDFLLDRQPDDEQAKRLLHEVESLQSKNDLTNLLVKLKMDRARHALAVGDGATARTNLREVLTIEPHHAGASSMLAGIGANKPVPSLVVPAPSPDVPTVDAPVSSPTAPTADIPAPDAPPPAPEMPVPPAPHEHESAEVLAQKKEFIQGNSIKEARLLISQKEYVKAEEKLIEALKHGPHDVATKLLTELRARRS